MHFSRDIDENYFHDEGDDEEGEDDASVWRQEWGSQLPCEVSAERMSGFRET